MHYSAQQTKKTRWATKQTTLFLIWLIFLAKIEKRSKSRLKKEIFMIAKDIALTKSWFVVCNFWEFPKDHTEKNALVICISYLKPKLFHYFQSFLVTEYLRWGNQTHFSYRNYYSIFVLRWDVFKLIKNPFIKIKKQLTLTSFNLVPYKIAGKY